MFYLAGKILIFLLLATALGFIIGWFLNKYLIAKKNNKLHFQNKEKDDNIVVLLDDNKELRLQLKQYKKKIKTEPVKKVNDNLQLIKGIGSVFQKRLNNMGILSFEQIAKWNETDIEKFSKKIGPFKKRIEHDNWIKQAQTLITERDKFKAHIN